MVHRPGAGGAGVQPRGVVEDRAVPYVRRERRLLRPRGAAGGAEGDARRVPHRRTATPRRRRHGRPDRHELPGADARALALQPRRARGIGGVRPHLATALPRRALRSQGTQHFGLAPSHGGRPDLGAAPEAQRSDSTDAAQHVKGPDGQRAGAGLHQYVGLGGGARQRHAELPGAGPPGDADAGDGLSIDGVVDPGAGSGGSGVVAPGPIVVLNGTPRSGKSSIAAALQGSSDVLWLTFGVDAMAAVTPARLRPGIGLRPGGERPDLEDGVVVLFDALYAAVAAWSRAGCCVVVDVGHHDDYSRPLGILTRTAATLRDVPAYFVGVRCPVKEI